MSQSRFCLAFLLLSGGVSSNLFAQDVPSTQFKMFGHFTSTIELGADEQFSDISLGEHDLFVQSTITPKVSFLGETVVAPLLSLIHI